MTEALKKRINDELIALKENGVLRQLTSPKGVDFSSNDYLGLAHSERLKSALIEGVKLEGVGSTASRLLRGERDCFRGVEQQFADWKGTEKALYFSTGYQANIGVMQTFLGKEDLVFSDELNHASLIDGISLSKCEKVIFPHCDAENLEKLLREATCEGQKFLVTESLFSMDGDIAPLKKYAEICRRTKTNLIVDEAHSVGLYGEKGSGLIEELGLEQDVFLSVNTAGKALGVSGAFVAGSDTAIEYLINRCRAFIFSTAPIPSIANALKVSMEIVEKEKALRKKLRDVCRCFRDLLIENNLIESSVETQIVPIIIGDSCRAVAIAEKLQFQGYDVRAIRPPTVAEGTSRLRISLNVDLTQTMLRNFVEALRREVES